ncbi:MAG: CMGC protein kinase [Amphiamblys sp. WSBS2006]|nr:MAG: CMGC protein kinase [Amphiamblys sp. WSBS2006]
MARRYLKHILLFFLVTSVIVGAAEGYKEADYERLDDICSGSCWTVSKVREKKTGKIYALKTFVSGPKGYEHAEKEISALEQLDHESIVKMRTSNIENRQRDDPVHIALEYLPCDLDAALSHPEIRENKKEILYQVLSGVAHIHSKKLAHGDIKPANILIDPTTMTVKICDFGFCCKGEEELPFPGTPTGGYYSDILSVAGLMVRLYLGESSLKKKN